MGIRKLEDSLRGGSFYSVKCVSVYSTIVRAFGEVNLCCAVLSELKQGASPRTEKACRRASTSMQEKLSNETKYWERYGYAIKLLASIRAPDICLWIYRRNSQATFLALL
jgi:hypothetical protein